MEHLHVERQLHLLLDAGEVDAAESVNERLLSDLVILVAVKSGEEAVVDDAWKVCVLKERNIVYVFFSVVAFARTHTSLRDVCEDVGEIRLDDLFKELAVHLLVELLDKEVILRSALSVWRMRNFWCV